MIILLRLIELKRTIKLFEIKFFQKANHSKISEHKTQNLVSLIFFFVFKVYIYDKHLLVTLVQH